MSSHDPRNSLSSYSVLKNGRIAAFLEAQAGLFERGFLTGHLLLLRVTSERANIGPGVRCVAIPGGEGEGGHVLFASLRL